MYSIEDARWAYYMMHTCGMISTEIAEFMQIPEWAVCNLIHEERMRRVKARDRNDRANRSADTGMDEAARGGMGGTTQGPDDIQADVPKAQSRGRAAIQARDQHRSSVRR